MIMQRMIASTVINKLLLKYQTRFDECQTQWDKDYKEMQDEHINLKRNSFLIDEINSLNTQLSAYECIIKDLKGLVE